MEGDRKIHLVGQAHTFLTKDVGGLGIRSHGDLNHTLLAKLGWKIIHDGQSLAKDCIASKYTHDNYSIAFRNGSHVWKNIGCNSSFLVENVRWKIAVQTTIRFCLYDWLGIGAI